jgi:large subunit ribosomal protein L24
MALKVLRGDEVEVIHGRNKGARGVVRQNLPADKKVVVEGVNIVRKHQRRQGVARQAGIIEVEAPLWASKVMVVCKSCDEPTRVGFRWNGDDKVRYCKKCDADIPRPDLAE